MTHPRHPVSITNQGLGAVLVDLEELFPQGQEWGVRFHEVPAGEKLDGVVLVDSVDRYEKAVRAFLNANPDVEVVLGAPLNPSPQTPPIPPFTGQPGVPEVPEE